MYILVTVEKHWKGSLGLTNYIVQHSFLNMISQIDNTRADNLSSLLRLFFKCSPCTLGMC